MFGFKAGFMDCPFLFRWRCFCCSCSCLDSILFLFFIFTCFISAIFSPIISMYYNEVSSDHHIVMWVIIIRTEKGVNLIKQSKKLITNLWNWISFWKLVDVKNLFFLGHIFSHQNSMKISLQLSNGYENYYRLLFDYP